MSEQQNETGRKGYIDVLKAVGIFSIYLGHLADAGGRLYPFIFTYHIPLFFFLAGCTETLGRERSYPQYVLHKIKTVLVPWLFFAVLSLVLYVINVEVSLETAAQYALQILQGCVRNRFLAGGLWFLTCLFVTSLIFRLMEKWNKILVLVLCILVYVASQTVLPSKPQNSPSWYWNVDSAMYALLYYCLGFLLFPYIDRALTGRKTAVRIGTGAVCTLSAAYCVLCFFEADVLSFLWNLPAVGSLLVYSKPLFMLPFFFGAAYLLKDIRRLQNIGRDTLYLCGSEYFAMVMIPALAGLVGLEVQITSPVAAVLYALIKLLFAEHFLVPAERYVLSELTAVFSGEKDAWNNRKRLKHL